MPENNKKINWYKPEFALFGATLVFGILFSILAFTHFSLSWFVASVIFFAAITGGSFFLGKAFNELKGKGELEQMRIDRLVSCVSDAIIVYDKDFRIIIWNRMAEETFKLKKENILGQVISPEKISDPSFKTLVQVIFPSLAPSVMKKSAPGEYPQLMDISFSDPILELSVSTDRLISEDGSPTGFIKIIRDRTREVEFLRGKSEFITVAAHQLRTPLTAVHWIFETVVKSETLSSDDQELISNGLAASAKLLKIVNDLLDVSKIESGKFGYTFTEIDIGMFLDDLLKNANILAKKYNVSLYFDRPKNPIFIHGDPQKLGIAFSNLLDNAIKYNVTNGQVIVKIEPYPNRPYIQISIKDTGVGMSKDALSKLFTKFFRGENITKSETEGSGLGLYITKNIILRHGGNISADSALGRGSTFYIVLPTDPALIPPKEVMVE
ncbi:MAG: ATP-binding protein [Parcubacteria group bacterium]